MTVYQVCCLSALCALVDLILIITLKVGTAIISILSIGEKIEAQGNFDTYSRNPIGKWSDWDLNPDGLVLDHYILPHCLLFSIFKLPIKEGTPSRV